MLPATKRIVILGGGTNTYISNHLALSAPAYGTTAKTLATRFMTHGENKMEVDLYLTDMCTKGRSFENKDKKPLDTPEDVEALVDKLIADPDTRVIIFNVAMVDYKPTNLYKERSGLQNYEDDDWITVKDTFGKYDGRLSTSENPELILELSVQDKIINKIRKERKDILLVGFKTTCGAPKEEMFNKGLKLCKDASANIVFVNDVNKDRIKRLNLHLEEYDKILNSDTFQHLKAHEKANTLTEDALHLLNSYRKGLSDIENIIVSLQNNGLVTPEESSYWYNTRDEALDGLVQMVLDRSHLHFTRSTVVDSETVPWNSEEIPNVLREVVDHCVAQGAYKTFTIGDSKGTKGSVGHFAYKVNETTFLTSKRKSNFNKLDKIGLVKVVTDGPDHIYAYGAKPSVGGQSQRIIFDMYPHLDCILHFHSPLRQEYRNEFSIKSQFEVECGSHECGQNTAQGLSEYVLDNGQKVYAVHLDHHGPNIVFSKDIEPQLVIDFIDTHWDLTRKTDGLTQESR